ncbi:MAG TPA: alpha-glucan family phosphorylase [Gammaproteobacteria bacterium]|nr:alpha-glucan family phosphorylase [Gammaproteobacteria bacterium]
MHTRDTSHKINLKGYSALETLALDLISSWNHSADILWYKIDPELWELTHNPWAVLQTASREKLSALLDDLKFSNLVNDLLQSRQEELSSYGWFQKNYAESPLKGIAYFSMEFMLSEALPIYSGGLGNVAGDQLKAASDLGVPVIAIGLLYSQGYFRQFIDGNGEQQELYPYNDPGQLPIRPLRLPNGEWLRLKIDLPGWPLWLRTWEVKVGRTQLYLLDTNDLANFPAHRGVTSELYGGDAELRLKQELVLGIGGWRLLNALSIQPEICHMNEGHAAFAVLERAFCYMQATKQPFEIALAATRAGNLFTTHTAVSAGFDHFSPDLITKYLKNYAQKNLGISIEKLLSLGQKNPHEDFNMAYLAIRGSNHINAVSQLHSAVSRHLFSDLFNRWPIAEIPIEFVTNGVHMPSWDSSESDQLWAESCGKGRWLGNVQGMEEQFSIVTDTKIWQIRNQSRTRLIDHARTRLVRQLESRNAAVEDVERAKTCLNPDTLTLGFARRFVSYKRPDLLLTDMDRLIRILTNQNRPVQLIIAGKAPPSDLNGHALIKKWVDFVKRPEVRSQAIFLSDYDMILTEYLVQGVDLWINTPRRPWEACGTSGMKVLVNGGLNLSELDGWWAEAYTPEVGWALGDRKEHGDDVNWDRAEAYALYDLLEQEVIPQFYSRDAQNIPTAWTNKIRASMASLTPRFSANRTVCEYTEKFYLPAAQNYQSRTANNSALAKQIADWQASVQQNWRQLRFGELKITMANDQYVFEVPVYLYQLDRQAVKIELYSTAMIKEMEHQEQLPNTTNAHIYRATVPMLYPAASFTPRIVPYFPGAVMMESPLILWQK